MKSFNFKSAANTKEATKMATGRTAFLAGGMTLLPAIIQPPIPNMETVHVKAPPTPCQPTSPAWGSAPFQY